VLIAPRLKDSGRTSLFLSLSGRELNSPGSHPLPVEAGWREEVRGAMKWKPVRLLNRGSGRKGLGRNKEDSPCLVR
jgi:hypothetical protein